MGILIQSMTGASVHDLYALATLYWIIPVGMIALYYYGMYHFNTPEYALSSGRAAKDSIRLPWNTSAARLRVLAPPIITTSRTQYRRYALLYVLVLEAAFLLITCVPDVVASAARISQQAQLQLSQSAQERGIWALFCLTGLLSSFPLFKGIDAWLLSSLHKQAVIPETAELTAATLFEAKFSPIPEARDQVIRDLKTNTVRKVAEGRASGTLETSWVNVRCLHLQVLEALAAPNHARVRRILSDDLGEIEEVIAGLRELVFEYIVEQERMLGGVSGDIDEQLDQEKDSDSKTRLKDKRRKLQFDVDAVFYRLCRLATLLVYAVEPRPEHINTRLRNFGFDVYVKPVPSWDVDAILKVAAGLAATIFIPSFVYGIASADMTPQDVAKYGALVPTTPTQLAIWTGSGILIHVSAMLIALRIKIYYARRAAVGEIRHEHDNVVAAVGSYVACAGLLWLLYSLVNAPGFSFLLWALLPGITGYFVAKYVERTMHNKPVSVRRASKQAGLMLVASLATCAMTLPDRLNEWPVPVVAFSAYASLTAALIGFTIGMFFQYYYQMRHHRAQGGDVVEGHRKPSRVGDMLLEQAAAA